MQERTRQQDSQALHGAGVSRKFDAAQRTLRQWPVLGTRSSWKSPHRYLSFHSSTARMRLLRTASTASRKQRSVWRSWGVNLAGAGATAVLLLTIAECVCGMSSGQTEARTEIKQQSPRPSQLWKFAPPWSELIFARVFA